jgi:hypothetical protein
MNTRSSVLGGAHAPPRAGDGALAIANFIPSQKDCFGEGAETSTRGACAPQNPISDF